MITKLFYPSSSEIIHIPSLALCTLHIAVITDYLYNKPPWLSCSTGVIYNAPLRLVLDSKFLLELRAGISLPQPYCSWNGVYCHQAAGPLALAFDCSGRALTDFSQLSPDWQSVSSCTPCSCLWDEEATFGVPASLTALQQEIVRIPMALSETETFFQVAVKQSSCFIRSHLVSVLTMAPLL